MTDLILQLIRVLWRALHTLMYIFPMYISRHVSRTCRILISVYRHVHVDIFSWEALLFVAHLICWLKWMTCAAVSHCKSPHYSHSCKWAGFASVQITGESFDSFPLTVCTQNTYQILLERIWLPDYITFHKPQPGQEILGGNQNKGQGGSPFKAYGC